MPLIGQTLAHYRITAALGAGGMGEVYRATDTRLDREVAIKVLPASHAGNPQFLARFEREAKTISALNHPHVCTLHDVGCEGAVHYLVMELIEGESLADRLKRGALPVQDVLRCGAQIAGALEAAHRHGIVHRDLKPGNVMLTRAGAKLLDFGLARTAAEGPSVISAPSTLQTENRPLTTQGTILGTFQYMAPEQLEGLEADARTDIFALGALLYEMATGQRAFRGESKTSLIAAIVSSQPTPVSQVVPMTPPAFDHVVRTCLAKDPEDRWQSARDVKAQLEWIVEGGSQAGAPAVVVSRRRQREQVAWVLVAVLALATGALLWTLRGRTPPPQNVVRFEVHAPPGTSFPDTWWGSPIVSPDGRQLAFAVREGSGKVRLWVRSLDSLETKPISDSDEGITPFWSPDSRSIAFVSNGTLKAVEVMGGAARVVAKPAAFGGAWSRDGVILFTPESVLGPLYRVSASGGPSQPVTTVDARGEIGHCCARFLPDGRFIYYALGKTSADGRQYVGSLGSSNRLPLSAAGIYAPPGFLLDAPPPKRTLLARPFDVTRLEPTGDVSFVTTETLARFGSADGGSFSVSESGVLAYRAVGAASSTRLVWFDRTGVPLGQVPANAGAQSPELSPDGRRLLFERRDAETGQRDVWVLELDRGVESRLSFEAGLDESDALWSPDGRRIVWSKRGDTQSFQEVAAAGGTAGVLHDFGSLTAWPQSWSPDGRHLLFGAWTGAGQGDLMVLPLEKRGEPEPFVATSFIEMNGVFSPDGRWVAYSSDETGRDEIYIRPFPKADGQWRVSTDGGTNPRWRPDGRELFYIAPDRKLMSVSITARPDSPALSAPRPLFQTRISGSLGRDVRYNYAVSRDGQRFLIVTDEGQPSSPPITVIVNWPELLKRNK